MQYGWTPLHTTCYYSGYEMVFMKKEEFLKRLKRVAELLLENGADATIPDNVSQLSIHVSTYHKICFTHTFRVVIQL